MDMFKIQSCSLDQQKLAEIRSKRKNVKQSVYKKTDSIDMSIFLGLILLSPIFRSAYENLLSLFSNRYNMFYI